MKTTAATVPLKIQGAAAPSLPPLPQPLAPGDPLPFTDPGRDPEWTGEHHATLDRIRDRTATLAAIITHLEADRLAVTHPDSLGLVASQLASVIQTWFMVLRTKNPNRPTPPLI